MTSPEDRPVPPAEMRRPEPSRAWIGILAVVFGAVLMFAGVATVYVYARRHPFGVTSSSAKAVPAPPVAAAPPPQPVPPPLPSAALDPDPEPSPEPGVATPFAEDALAPVPVHATHPLWGARDAPVTLTLFADLECPHSVPLVRTVLSEKARRGGKLRLAFRHLPLSQHSEGTRAALALAQVYGALGDTVFWRALGAIVRRGEPLAPDALGPLLESAGAAGYPLDPPPAASQRQVEEDAVLAVRLFVRVTPTLFVNGTRLEGFQPEAALSEAISREERSAYLALANGTPKSQLYSERARNNLLNLGDDPPERSCVPALDSPARGAPMPLVELVEFSDLECELCRDGHAAVETILRSHSRELRHVWKNFPLPQHQRAHHAAGFALEARRAGGDSAFFAVIAALLERGANPDEAGLIRAAGKARLDPGALLNAAGNGVHDDRIAKDVELAKKLGLNGAPTYFVNGRKILGALSAPELETIVREELALARRVRTRGSGNVADLVCGITATKR